MNNPNNNYGLYPSIRFPGADLNVIPYNNNNWGRQNADENHQLGLFYKVVFFELVLVLYR